jgi:YbgC/YbaW family acyl-CoA thioester hydrolase
MPISEYRYRRRAQFADTDMAGVVHFSWIARYLEEAEHALWRAAGLSILPPDSPDIFLRVNLSIDFKAPLHFEEEFEVHIRIESMSTRSIRYAHVITRGDTVIATGSMTAVCARKGPDGLRAAEIPAEVRERLSAWVAEAGTVTQTATSG